MPNNSMKINTTSLFAQMTQVRITFLMFVIVLFGTNISNEMFEFAKAFGIEMK